MKPVIIYIDDEPRNLTVFEASVPDTWEVKTFESAVDALKVVKNLNPSVIVCDQRMPMMTGLEFLEVSAQLVPDAVRVVVTGQTEEQTIIQLIRRAKIFDYIAKPWDTDQLLACLEKSIDFYRALTERNSAFEALSKKNAELEKSNAELTRLTSEIEEARKLEVELRKEVEAWAPASVVWALKEGKFNLPVRRDIVGIVYDIVNSSKMHGVTVNNLPIRAHILRTFTEALVKKGGIKESQAGDSAYGHFGAFTDDVNAAESALAAAQEFRVALRSVSKMYNVEVESGIALSLAPDTLIQLHEIRTETPNGFVVQKFIDSESTHIDILHRMEKLTHDLPGSNIIMTDAFVSKLREPPGKLVLLGETLIKGINEPMKLYLLPSDLVTKERLDAFIAKYFAQNESAAA